MKARLLLVVGTLVCTTIVLGLGELYCRSFTDINFLDSTRGLFVDARFAATYGNTPNFTGISFGQTFHTDEHGFRVDQTFHSAAAPDAPAILILGDSVSFGPGLTDDVTIAGQLRRRMPSHRFYNASAIGYDTFDYFNVGSRLVEQLPEVKTVLLFLCLNDIGDVSAQLIRTQVSHGRTEESVVPPTFIRRVNAYLRSRSKLYLWFKQVVTDTPMTYFRYDLAGYQMGDANVRRALQPVIDLDRVLKARGIAMHVFVTPDAVQLRPGVEPAFLLPQQMITGILVPMGVDLHDTASAFASLSPHAERGFLYGDPTHLNATGSARVADAVCAVLGDCLSPH